MFTLRRILTSGLVALAAATPLLAGPAHAATTQPASAVAAQPLNIVAIGDSFASGQGDIGAGWIDPACYRSAGAAPERAAGLLNAIQPVTFTSFACSGSVIEPEAGSLTTNVSPAQTLLGNGGLNGQLYAVDPGRNTPVDALTISIGGNDINFHTVVEACMVPLNSCSTDPTINAMVTGSLDLLPGELGDLIKAVNARTDIDNVFLTEYPDPTTGPYGAWCGAGGPYPGFGGLDFISQADAIWASEHVIQPLNAALQSAVGVANARRGPGSPVWHYLSGMYNAFYGHGYCTGSNSSILFDTSPNAAAAAIPRYVNTLLDSEASQGDENGTMHPNDAGQQAMAGVIYHDYLAMPLMGASVSASFPPVAEDASFFTVQARTFAGTPIAGASVLDDGNLIGHTDSSGVLNVSGYVFSAAGTHTIVAQAAGYPDAQAVLAVQARSYSATSNPSPIPMGTVSELTLTATDNATGQVIPGTFTVTGSGTVTVQSAVTADNVTLTMGSKTETIIGPTGKPIQVKVPVCPTLTFQPDSAAYAPRDFSSLISCTP